MLSSEIGSTGVSLTQLGFGGASLGNLYRVTSQEDADSALDQAWKSGIRYFDTAPHYGLGLSERRIGTGLASRPRGEYVISTKVGRLLVPQVPPTELDPEMFVVPGDWRREWDFSRDGVLRSVESSLARLRTDRIDILLLHDPDISGIEKAAETGAAALIELRDQGVVGAVGIGSNSSEAVAELFSRADIDLAMLAGRYTLMEPRGADAVFEAARGRAIVSAGVFNSGLLANDRPRPDATYNYEPANPQLIREANVLAEICEQHGATLPQAALAFPLRNPAVGSVVLGMRNAQQVAHNVKLAEAALPPSLWSELENKGLI